MSVSAERIVSIDVVRGFAVLGILLMNVTGMGLPATAYLDPTFAGGHEGADFWMWSINFVLTDGKMRGLFTMLFGASMVLIAERADGQRPGPVSIHYRRMAWLLIFGLLHAYLLWWGDILVCYAIAGAIVFVLRTLTQRTLLICGVCILAMLTVLNVATGIALEDLRFAAHQPDAAQADLDAWAAASFALDPPAEARDAEIAAMRGGILEAIGARAVNLAFVYPNLLPFEVIEAVGQMMIGIALFRSGFFSLGWSSGSYLRLAALGYGIAVPVTAWLAWRAWDADFDVVVLNEMVAWSAVPRPFIALAHASTLLLCVRLGCLGALKGMLAAAGRMALSNYLLTSLITTFVFCGFGLGLFGALSRAELMIVVLAIWAFILLWSGPWLRHFAYGPFEWIWRALVRWRLPPFRRPPAIPPG
ncbi:MAG: DUF418 domain-containing protein [Alphaproteobacteria bacterium]|nr:DUF418 domain-containing protein [Alphaproteobacteria bacterium]